MNRAKFGLGRAVRWLCASLALLAAPQLAPAAVVFTGSGINNEAPNNTVSGSATFTVSGNQLIVDIVNTTPDSNALRRADVLTGFVFDVNGTVGLDLASVTRNGADIYTDATTINNSTVIGDYWTDSLSTPGTPYDFGAAATGFGGLFSAGDINLGGGSVNGGIVGSAGVLDNQSFNANAFPLAVDHLRFTFTITSGTLTEGQIHNVNLLFGTSGEGIITTVPVPPTAILGLVGIASLGLGRLRKKKA